jgi:hypothetical protein
MYENVWAKSSYLVYIKQSNDLQPHPFFNIFLSVKQDVFPYVQFHYGKLSRISCHSIFTTL